MLHSAPRKLRRHAVVVLACTLAVAAGVVNGWRVRARNAAERRAEFELRVDEAERELRSRFDLYARGLRAARAVVSAAGLDATGRTTLRAYLAARNLPREFPGAHGFGLIRRARPGELPSLLADIRAELGVDAPLKHLGPPSAEHFVIQLIEPRSTNASALGLDIATESSRRDAALAAARTGTETLTAPITLAQGARAPNRGFLLLLALGAPPEGGPGWVYAPLIVDDVLDAAPFTARALSIALSDSASALGATPFYRSHAEDAVPGTALRTMRQVPIHGRTWTLSAVALPGFFAHAMQQSPLLAGAATTSVAWLLIALLSVGAARLRHRVQSEFASQLGQAAPEPMVVVDAGGRIRFANGRAAQVFGYPASALVGESLELLLPERYRAGHVELRRSFDGRPRAMGLGRDLHARRASGSEFPVEVSLGPLRVGGETWTAAMIVDITRRRRLDEHVRLFQQIFQRSELAIVVTTPEGVIEHVNPALLRVTGYPDEAQVLGQHYSLLLTAESDLTRPDRVARAIRGEAVVELVELRRYDGSAFTSQSAVGALTDEHGRPTFLFNIFSDYSKEQERQAELRLARDHAEDASRAKTEFLSSMSHELRTPLNAVVGFAQLLEDRLGRDPDGREMAHAVFAAGSHLLDLVNEILDLARVDAGRIALSLEPVQLGPLIDECVGMVRPLAERREILIAAEPLGQVRVHGDRMRVKQALLNLLSNAIKYNRDRGRVDVMVLPSGDETRLRIGVRDTGHGIAGDALGALFTPFTRLPGKHGPIEGTGIGLALTRKLVEAMGGRVGAESVIDGGSTFWLELPLAEGVPAGPETSASPRIPVAVATPRRRLLYIDDNPLNVRLVERIVALKPDLELYTSLDSNVALDLALAHRPDLVLLDISMPGLDGYQVLALLRGTPELASTKVVALTAHAHERDVERGLQAGFDAYLTKPLDVKRFLDTIEGLIRDGRSAPPARRGAAGATGS